MKEGEKSPPYSKDRMQALPKHKGRKQEFTVYNLGQCPSLFTKGWFLFKFKNIPYLENRANKCFIWKIMMRNTRREVGKWNRERSWPIKGMFLNRWQLLAAGTPILLRSPGRLCKLCLRDMLSWRYLPSNSTSHWPRTTARDLHASACPTHRPNEIKLCMESHKCAAQSRDWMGIEMVNSDIQAEHHQCLLCQIPLRFRLW